MKKVTLSIGIPVYNEEKNIRYLLADISQQKMQNLRLEKVIIISDGSNDDTVKAIYEIKKKKKKTEFYSKIKLFAIKQRSGVAVRQNQIMKFALSDVLVLLNADIRIIDKSFLEKLVKPITNEGKDLVACSIQEVTASSLFEEILSISMKFKHILFNKLNDGKNVYTCFGAARAFSRRLYKKINFESSVGEDAYSYFYCVCHNFKYHLAKDAHVYYKLPDSLRDHARQSIRFEQSRKKYIKTFGEEFIKNEYHVPILIVIIAFMKVFTRYPIHTITYVFIYGFTKMKSMFEQKITSTWEISTSSKSIQL